MQRNSPVENINTINKHAFISLSKNLDNAMAHGMELNFLIDENGNQGSGGINDYPAARELEEWVRGYVKEKGG